MHLASLPVRKLSRVFHVGTLDPTRKGAHGPSLEGAGLSVSLHPKEWARIARLEGTTFELTCKEGQFLDSHKLSGAAHRQLLDWGISNGWCQLHPRWKVTWTDLEDDEVRYTLFESEAAAQQELEGQQDVDPSASLEEVQAPVFTQAAQRRLGFSLGSLVVPDLLTTFYVEDHTNLDGVWWNDRLAPFSLSAPRGVILPARLARWARRPFGA